MAQVGNVYYDGIQSGATRVAEPNGPPIISYPLAHAGNLVKKISQSFMIKTGNYRPLGLGSPYSYTDIIPDGGSFRFVGDSDVNYLGADIVEFTSTWCQVPQSHEDGEPFVFALDYKRNGQIITLTKQLNSVLVYRYVHTNNPSAIALSRAFTEVIGDDGTIGRRWTGKGGGNTGGGLLSLSKGGNYLCEDETYTRWMGNIFQIKSRYCQDPNPGVPQLI